MRNKILCSDEIKIEHSGLNAKCYVWRKPATIPTVTHSGSSIFFNGRDWETSKDRDEQRNVERSLMKTCSGQVSKCP